MKGPPRESGLTFRSTREAELALCCAGIAVGGRDAAAARKLLSGKIDWETLTHFATNHAILPLVHSALTSSLEGSMPAEVAQGLRRRFQGNAIRNVFLARELVRLTSLFEQAGLQTISFKGPALAVAAYGSVNLRQFVDLDLLVRWEQAGRAIEVLRADGYVAPVGYGEVGRPGAFETSMVKAGASVNIDLHWGLAEPYLPLAMDGEDLWRRAIRIEIEGGAVNTLGLEDHLLYLCGHGARHGWETLSGVCDVAQLIRVAPIDWGVLCARAQECGGRRMLLLGVLLAHDLIGASAPARILEDARREHAIMRAARTFVRSAADPKAVGPGLYQRWSIPVRMIESPMARIRYVAGRALLPSADDRGVLNLPPILAPLYYVLRPLRIALKQGRAAIHRLQTSGDDVPPPSA